MLWYTKLFSANMVKISKAAKMPGVGLPEAVAEVLQGVGVRREHVVYALNEAMLQKRTSTPGTKRRSRTFAGSWDTSKPTIIIANKMDLPFSAENFKALRKTYNDLIVVPTSGDAELSLRRAQGKGLIKYVPGEERFEVSGPQQLSDAQR